MFLNQFLFDLTKRAFLEVFLSASLPCSLRPLALQTAFVVGDFGCSDGVVSLGPAQHPWVHLGWLGVGRFF